MPPLLVFGIAACTGLQSPTAPAAPRASADADTHAPPPGPTRIEEASGELEGPCEASGLAPWEGGFLVGDNEDVAQLYAFDDAFAPRPPAPLAVEVGDIEAIAHDGAGVWVVGSHSTNRDGETKAKRDRILRPDGEVVTLDLSACPYCEAFRGVSTDAGGFNVEGAARVGDRLWLGLRAPLTPSGEALLLEVEDDGRVVEVVPVDLDGAGVRALTPAGEGLLVVSGPTGEVEGDEPHGLWRLDTPEGAPARLPLALPPSTEGVALDPEAPGALVYVTDGAGQPGECTTPARWGRLAMP